uniref:NP2 n=1 Tax=Octopus kaurna TaxID=243731 RepID=B6Z1Y9_OCTKA|nr:NP2 [Octopus kaurna]
MKSIVFLCFLLVGIVSSDGSCEDEAKTACPDAMGTYPLVKTMKDMCNRLSMIRSCMEQRKLGCFEHFDEEYERKCKRVHLPDHPCVSLAEKVCGDAMGTYPDIKSTVQLCYRTHMFKGCMQAKNPDCVNYFDLTAQKTCSLAVLYSA